MPLLLIKYALSYIWSIISSMAELTLLSFIVEQCLYLTIYLFSTLFLMTIMLFFAKRTLKTVAGWGQNIVAAGHAIMSQVATSVSSLALPDPATGASSLRGSPTKELEPPRYSAERLMKSAKKESLPDAPIPPAINRRPRPPAISSSDLARRARKND